jgi:dienelactone hydrolase
MGRSKAAALTAAAMALGMAAMGERATAQTTNPPAGEVKGAALVHTSQSLAASAAQASLVLPAAATGGAAWTGKLKDAPKTAAAKVPVVIFLHGSSGLGLKAIGEWQAWLATLGYASLAPDSFTLPDRLTYTSPISKEIYEKMHALRASEIGAALDAVKDAPWADATRLALAGSSEGAPAVARNDDARFAARLIYSWSCEDNYFVSAHGTKAPPDQPVLNVMSTVDPFFSKTNAWLASPTGAGHCGAALADAKRATIVLIPGAPHTLLTLPQAKAATRAFLEDAFAR